MQQDDPIPAASPFGLSTIAERLIWARKQQGPGRDFYLNASRDNREADGISDRLYCDFEDGEVIPTWDQLIDLSKTFNVSARYLQEGTGPIDG